MYVEECRTATARWSSFRNTMANYIGNREEGIGSSSKSTKKIRENVDDCRKKGRRSHSGTATECFHDERTTSFDQLLEAKTHVCRAWRQSCGRETLQGFPECECGRRRTELLD